MNVGSFVRWVRADYESFVDMTLWASRFKFATGEVVREHEDGDRVEVFWRWPNGESSISLHSRSTLAIVSLLDVMAKAADE